jgi:predicted membrane channel-forming protein YqfA (hemolysin III family)
VFCHSIVTAVFGFFYALKDPEVINQILYGMLYILIGLLPLVILPALAHDSRGVSAINPEAER